MNASTRAPGRSGLGRVEYVVESRRSDGRETWLVMREETGARVVVEADTLKPIGVLERAAPPNNHPAGFNPYFDPPIGA